MGVKPAEPNDKDTVGEAEDQTRQQLEHLVKKSDRVLYEATTVFPFDLFPDKVIVDDHKVDIIYSNFFFTRSVFPMFIKDIRTVSIYTNILFGQLTFEMIGFERNPPAIKNLWKNDAIQIRRLIIGLIAAFNQNIDLTNLPKNELLEKVEEVGLAVDSAGQKL